MLLSSSLGERQLVELDTIFEQVAVSRRSEGFFYVKDVSYKDHFCKSEVDLPLSYEVLDVDLGAADLQLVAKRWGRQPAAQIAISTYGGSLLEHVLLGIFSLMLAVRFSGWINFQGALMPNFDQVQQQLGKLYFLEKATWQEVRPIVQTELTEIGGELLELPARTPDHRAWANHIGDSVFMDGWLKHNNFHMPG